MIIPRLVVSYCRVRKVRTSLTIAAIALSVSLVVAVTSGYASIMGAAVAYFNQIMGAADAFVAPANEGQGALPQSLVDELSADPDVNLVVGRLETDRPMHRAEPLPPRPDPENHSNIIPRDMIDVNLTGVRRPQDTKTNAMEIVGGQWFSGDDGDFAMADQAAAEKLGVKIGDTVEVPGPRRMSLIIMGIVHKPSVFADSSPTLYLPLRTLQRFTQQDNPPQLTRIGIDLRAGSDQAAFKQRWETRFKQIDQNIILHMRRENSGQLENNLRTVRFLSYLGGAVAMITAMFITFSALSMGVSERQRVFGMLRAVGLTRGQVFRMVILEAGLVSIIGIAIGIPLGMLWLQLLTMKYSDLFFAGAFFSFDGILLGAAGSAATTVVASMLPAWTASRISPMEAINAVGSATVNVRAPWRLAVLGVILASIDPLVIFGPADQILTALHVRDTQTNAPIIQFVLHTVAGLPGVMVGFFLVAPLLVWVAERLAAPVMARVFSVPVKLLRQQLSGGMWRAAGTAAALMVGLATLTAMQIHGSTLINGLQLPDRVPDVFVMSQTIVPWDQVNALEEFPGIQKGTLMPIVPTTPTGDGKASLAIAQVLARAGTGLLFVGVDPDQATQMIELDFRDNDGKPYPREQQEEIRRKTVEAAKKGRQIIVTDEFRQSRHVKIGDTIELLTSINGKQTYTICAIVWASGADMLSSLYDMSKLLDQQTIGTVFGTIDDAKRDFGVKGAWLFAANLQPGLDKADLLKNLQDKLGQQGLYAGDIRQIKYSIDQRLFGLLALASTVAFAAMFVASMGVTNTVMASVRSRRWQFGVLRSIGVSRAQLLRMVMAEAAMLGLAGMVLGLGAGMEIAFDAHRLANILLGYSPSVHIPWTVLGIGCLTVLGVALGASIWPAASVARSQPLELLSAGRSSM